METNLKKEYFESIKKLIEDKNILSIMMFKKALPLFSEEEKEFIFYKSIAEFSSSFPKLSELFINHNFFNISDVLANELFQKAVIVILNTGFVENFDTVYKLYNTVEKLNENNIYVEEYFFNHNMFKSGNIDYDKEANLKGINRNLKNFITMDKELSKTNKINKNKIKA